MKNFLKGYISHWSIWIIFVSIFSCSKEEEDVRPKEESPIKTRLENINKELNNMGFKIDFSLLNISVKEKNQMEEIFNKLNNQSDKVLFNKRRLAFYDPNSKTIFVENLKAPFLTDGYLAHELVHAWQDQTYGFNNIWQKYHDNPSVENFNIITYVVEGHAELVRTAFEQEKAPSKVHKNYLADYLTTLINDDCIICSGVTAENLPYKFGLRYLIFLYKKGGWDLVNQILNNLPSSTKEIINPKYSFIKKDIDINRPNSLPALGLILKKKDTLGQAHLIKKLLNSFVDKKEINLATTGFYADRMLMYEDEQNKELLVWQIFFENDKEALEFLSMANKSNLKGKFLIEGEKVDWIINKSNMIKPN